MDPSERWIKRRCRADEKLVCWATLRIITRGETYYEYKMDGMDEMMGGTMMNNIIINEKEYFKQALLGFRGFKFYDKN